MEFYNSLPCTLSTSKRKFTRIKIKLKYGVFSDYCNANQTCATKQSPSISKDHDNYHIFLSTII